MRCQTQSRRRHQKRNYQTSQESLEQQERERSRAGGQALFPKQTKRARDIFGV